MKTIKVDNFSEIPKNFTGIVEYPSGTKSWLKNGKQHRENGPAIECLNGTKEWWVEDELHRENGPAVEHSSGLKEWYIKGELHRENGPAIECSNGTKEWCLESNFYNQINLNDFVVLDYFKGKYGLMWYRLLDKNEIFECPDIPGLIEK